MSFLNRKPRKLSWKPKRKGRCYCAPACGRGCTWDEYKEAKTKGLKLMNRMGKGWTLRVWENMGWHYCVHSPCGRIKLHPGYTAFLGERDSGGGLWTAQDNMPEKAVLKVIRIAKRELAKLGAVIKGL